MRHVKRKLLIRKLRNLHEVDVVFNAGDEEKEEKLKVEEKQMRWKPVQSIPKNMLP